MTTVAMLVKFFAFMKVALVISIAKGGREYRGLGVQKLYTNVLK